MDGLAPPELETLLRFVGRLHPAATHFPIALLIVGALAEVNVAVRRRHRHSSLALTCLLLGTLAGCAAAWFGWVRADLEPPGKAAADVLFWHRWIGIAVVVAGAAALLLRAADAARPTQRTLHVYRGTYLVAALLVATVGYLGGEIVFGKNHLFEVFNAPTAPAPAPTAPVDTGTPPPTETPAATDEATLRLYVATIRPVLEESCHHCHGPRRQKGALRLDVAEDLATVIVAGDPGRSVLYQRISLPFDHPDLMPADDDRLPEDIVQAFRQWIEKGAPTDQPPPVTLHLPDATETHMDVTDPLEATLATLRAEGIRAVRLKPETTDIAVNLSLLQSNATDDTLRTLIPLGDHLKRLDLGGTAVTDDGLEALGAFPSLVRLDLRGTAVTDRAMPHLADLHALELLDCRGTALTDAAIDTLARLPELRTLHLGGTAITADGLDRLAQLNGTLEVTVND